MDKLYSLLLQDVRFKEGLKACMNCGVCTAICPASEFYNYDPRIILDKVQTRDDKILEDLLRSETIWYCGQCMSCKTRCPRGNTPGLVIMALRMLSQKLGYFTDSEKGLQQFALKRTIGENVLKYGYCAATYVVNPDLHPEQGPIWRYMIDHLNDIMEKLGANLNKTGEGALRRISDKALSELSSIFEVTGAIEFYNQIERHSMEKAQKLGMEFHKEGIEDDFFKHTYKYNSGTHNN